MLIRVEGVDGFALDNAVKAWLYLDRPPKRLLFGSEIATQVVNRLSRRHALGWLMRLFLSLRQQEQLRRFLPFGSPVLRIFVRALARPVAIEDLIQISLVGPFPDPCLNRGLADWALHLTLGFELFQLVGVQDDVEKVLNEPLLALCRTR